jgi:membrane-bound serine protease (ClpP class)
MGVVARADAALILAALAMAALELPPSAVTAREQEARPRVVVAEYDGVVHPIAAEFVDDLVSRAESSGAALGVLVLRTPGGLLDSTRTIVSRLIASRVPMVVFVAPSGSRAASAGFLITLAADVAVMAPGTHIGAAHPVRSGGAPEGDQVMAEKATADTAAYARTIAEARRRNSELASLAVTESRAFTEHEALAASPPLIDFVAADLDDLLRQLDGREIRRFDGRTAPVAVAGADIVTLHMTWRQSLLSAIAHPQVAYLLFTLGMLGLVVEFWNPGFVLPGVAGGICLLLAFFAFQVLPINVTGLLLIVFGIALLGAELMVPSFGVLGIGGTVALLAGSVMITREVPGLTVGYGVILPVVVAAVAVILGLGRLALQAQRSPSVTGVEGMIGAIGQTLTAIDPSLPGQMQIRGEIWRAASQSRVESGRAVRVTGIDGLTLHVEPVGVRDAPGGAS